MVATKAPKQVMKAKRLARKTVRKGSLRSALLCDLKNKTGRKDINFASATAIASKSMDSVPIEERAGYPVKLKPGSVHPRDWKTHNGVKIIVDFSRCCWLPDDWGQGVKQTQPTARSTGGGGGILTTFVAPDGKSFFHKETSMTYAGKELTSADGWNGQIRVARLQARQQLMLARAEGSNGGLDKDETLFKLLSAAERRCLPSKDEFHICVVSARRATKLEGVRDIFMVQSQFEEAGLSPTWYVDEGSVKDYKALGLNAVVGGKLTASRNKALRDARNLGKVCVQVSDDISCWEYRDGANAKIRDDDAMNAAHAAAKRLIISPVAAARFIVAKMRGAEGPKPKLGGVYMLSSCSRTFFSDPFARHNFILGDFFVVEPDSTVNFDPNMNLKEDYDFTCSHIAKYGSIIRCQRMTLNVKHYDNGGGACSNRDKKGLEEQRNIAILNQKWPHHFRSNPKRKNEVIMKWKASAADAGEGEDSSSSTKGRSAKTIAGKVKQVKKTILKKKPSFGGFSPDAVLVRTDKESKSNYIRARCAFLAGKTVGKVISAATYRDENGESHTYGVTDLKYDLKCGYLSVKNGSKKH